jgi:hypothetical protein
MILNAIFQRLHCIVKRFCFSYFLSDFISCLSISNRTENQATEAVNATKQALNGVEKLAEDKQHAGESMNQFNQLTPAQQLVVPAMILSAF